MIKTQLCPAGELENKNWWHLDVIVLLLVMMGSYYAVTMYIDERKAEVSRLVEKKAHWEKELEAKKPHIEKFQNLNNEMATLNQKIGALSKITTSKVDKVKPLVALDQLQTLWMDGVWYESLDYKDDGSMIIQGSGSDSLIIGEYMLGLRETMNNDTRNDDVRTQLGFDQLSLKNAKLNEASDEIFKDIPSKMQFELSAKHREKQVSQSPSVSIGPPPRKNFGSRF